MINQKTLRAVHNTSIRLAPSASHQTSRPSPSTPYNLGTIAQPVTFAQIPQKKTSLPVPTFNVPEISLQTPSEVAKFLKPGDILIKYSDGVVYNIDRQIWLGHKITLSTRGYKFNLPDPWRITHCLLAQGGSRISDANEVTNGPNIRTIDFFKHKVFDDSLSVRYMIFRPKDPQIGLQAAIDAQKFTVPFVPDPQLVDTTAHFAHNRGAYAMIVPAKMTKEGVKRFIKAAIYGQILHRDEQVPSKKNGLRDYYCSYFINWCYQSAEGDRLFKNLGIQMKRTDFETNGRPDPQKVSAAAKKLAGNPQIARAIRNIVFNKDAKWANPIDTLDIVMNKGAFDLVGVLKGYVDYNRKPEPKN